MTAQHSKGAQAFMEGLRQCGLQWTISGDVLTFPLAASGGAIETGVALCELDAWPMAPPHWVHLPADVPVGQTNAKPSSIRGWLMHSRNAARWGNAKHAVQAWLAHVHAVVEIAEAA
jgi:hypothetical protein